LEFNVPFQHKYGYIRDDKFALRPHHVWKYGRHPISDRWD